MFPIQLDQVLAHHAEELGEVDAGSRVGPTGKEVFDQAGVGGLAWVLSVGQGDYQEGG